MSFPNHFPLRLLVGVGVTPDPWIIAADERSGHDRRRDRVSERRALGPLWGARPDDWALTEDQQMQSYEEALRRVGLQRGRLVLDIGCGVGVFLRLVADRGARPFGLDASDALIELARKRVPDADLRVGEIEALPYEDDTFDLVTGFTSFFFANDIVAALGEGGRVAKPGAPVVIQVLGPTSAATSTR